MTERPIGVQAERLGISHMLVHRMWARSGTKPHRIKRNARSNDRNFEKKAADLIGLYLNPPQYPAGFYVGEKAIQALDRLDPVLPLSSCRLQRHGLESYPTRHSFADCRLEHPQGNGVGSDGR